MKNKKLFAILTLVCFMFTLMPVAAFAATNDVIDAEESYFVAVDGDETVRLNPATATTNAGKTNEIEFELGLYDANEQEITGTTGTVYVWAENASGDVSSALEVVAGANNSELAYVYKVDAPVNGKVVKVQFLREGKYTVYAGVNLTTETTVKKVTELTKLTNDDASVITVKAASVNPDTYTAKVEYDDNAANDDLSSSFVNPNVFYTMDVPQVDADGNPVYELDAAGNPTTTQVTADEDTVLVLTPNNVMTDDVTVTFQNGGKALKNEDVIIETNSSAIEVDFESATTNNRGQIKFTVSASIEGEYEIDFTVDGVTWTLLVEVGNTAAAYIETVTEPTAPVALYDTMGTDVIEFSITDINGNEVTKFDEGMDGINGNDGAKYVVLTEKPADSDLESEELELDYNGDNWYLKGVNQYDAEGTYAVKVILDNGAYATAEWTVKKFQTPVRLIIGTATDTVELGGRIGGALKYIDANGVQKNATDADVAATGYAVAGVVNDPVGANGAEKQKFNVTVKTDEKYVGATITVTAVSEKYDLVATKEFKVAAGAVAVKYVGGNAEVDVNNKLEWNIVDEEGNKVALGGAAVNDIDVESIKYVVLDKPEGAKVSVNDKTDTSDLYAKGVGMMALTSNKVGNVTVQIVVEAAYHEVGGTKAEQTKYYTGVAVIPVGMDATGDVVVMSIGSDQIVVNDEIKTIPAPAVVKDSRTFVPFRALAEAFGAEVAWDAATQSVTAELNGVTIVLTIGSNAYTVNGVERTADVAPYIAGDGYTMVPARAIAEEFGMKVLFTTDANGAVADVLYLM